MAEQSLLWSNNFEANFSFQNLKIFGYQLFSFVENVSRKHFIVNIMETFTFYVFLSQKYKYDNFLSKIGAKTRSAIYFPNDKVWGK